MKRRSIRNLSITFFLILSMLVGLLFASAYTLPSRLQSGDIIFQTSQSAQSQAIQIVTQSKYSHMGIIYQIKDKTYVYEAVQPVKLTPLDEWIKRGKNGHFVVKRLKNADEILTPAVLLKMKQVGEPFMGKNYDSTFEWNDQRIYCSELVWKIYQRATGLEVGKLETMKDFDLSHPIVQQKIKERFGNHPPLNETVISPQAIYDSPLLKRVY